MRVGSRGEGGSIVQLLKCWLTCISSTGFQFNPTWNLSYFKQGTLHTAFYYQPEIFLTGT